MGNIAYIDGQNLYLGTKEEGWAIDHKRFRVYLKEKYKIDEVYYFLGFVNEVEQDLYDKLQKAGFILAFREHSKVLKGLKKGNVDSDIIFHVMRKLAEGDMFDTVFLISGDGDYKKMVDYLIKKKRFGKILFPNKKFASSLYKSLGGEYFDYLSDSHVRSKIRYRKT